MTTNDAFAEVDRVELRVETMIVESVKTVMHFRRLFSLYGWAYSVQTFERGSPTEAKKEYWWGMVCLRFGTTSLKRWPPSRSCEGMNREYRRGIASWAWTLF
jgi:hypothetical protein